MGKSKNNKGFTLTELIIAVAVLGIVISPLVANFIQSARINKKARISLNATNMAQDIMEGASAYTAEEFVEMFESEVTLINKILPATTKGYTSHGDCNDDGTPHYAAEAASFDTEDGDASTRRYTTEVKAGIAQNMRKLWDDGSKVSDYYLFADGVEIGKSKYNLKFHLSTDKTKQSCRTIKKR